MTFTQQLTEAREQITHWRQMFAAATTRAARRNADKQLDWWIGKVSFLGVAAKREQAAA
jgi:hypothetical protein